MMKIKFSIFIALVFIVMNSASAATYNVLQGTFYIEGVTPEVTVIPGVGSFTEGVFDKYSPLYETMYAETGLEEFQFFGSPEYAFFFETGLGGDIRSAPTVDLVNLTADFSSFVWIALAWYHVDSGAIAQLTPIDDFYRASWSSLILGGPFDGFTSEWTMDIRPVPLPSAFWLFASGLIGMFGLSRRKYNTR
ncbi:MAG: VPLPA-CTERM sorting domain-containing protein [Gammaproteobacteria bacterium]|nr:VPLPA-CTERM sorting domain-containing protein [Gammaproteobacteria bacterium]